MSNYYKVSNQTFLLLRVRAPPGVKIHNFHPPPPLHTYLHNYELFGSWNLTDHVVHQKREEQSKQLGYVL